MDTTKKALVLLLCPVLLTCAACMAPAEVPSETPFSTVTVSPAPAVSAAPSPPPSPPPVPAGPLTPRPTPSPPPEPADGALVHLQDYIPNVRVALAYATSDNFTGTQIYDFTSAYLRYGTAKKLAAASAELAEMGLGLLVWDAFRPANAQARLWEAYPDPAYVSPPGTGYRAHCRGSAVDLTLVALATGEALPMPTGFDDFSPLADRDYSDCAAEEAENARLLEQVMARHGFAPYEAEWWHYSDTTEHPIEEHFDPAAPGAGNSAPK